MQAVDPVDPDGGSGGSRRWIYLRISNFSPGGLYLINQVVHCNIYLSVGNFSHGGLYLINLGVTLAKGGQR
jgi:hypothetical protein